jgi:hypothetical protein
MFAIFKRNVRSTRPSPDAAPDSLANAYTARSRAQKKKYKEKQHEVKEITISGGAASLQELCG